jgi:nucleoid DNA-binding protein
MDKPISLSIREYLVRTLAPKLLVSEKVIDQVIVHQFSEANAAMSNNESLELSGFGKLLFNKKKAYKKMEKFMSQKALFEAMIQNPDTSEQRRHAAKLKLNTVLNNIDVLKPKI